MEITQEQLRQQNQLGRRNVLYVVEMANQGGFFVGKREPGFSPPVNAEIGFSRAAISAPTRRYRILCRRSWGCDRVRLCLLCTHSNHSCVL